MRDVLAPGDYLATFSGFSKPYRTPNIGFCITAHFLVTQSAQGYPLYPPVSVHDTMTIRVATQKGQPAKFTEILALLLGETPEATLLRLRRAPQGVDLEALTGRPLLLSINRTLRFGARRNVITGYRAVGMLPAKTKDWLLGYSLTAAGIAAGVLLAFTSRAQA